MQIVNTHRHALPHGFEPVEVLRPKRRLSPLVLGDTSGRSREVSQRTQLDGR